MRTALGAGLDILGGKGDAWRRLVHTVRSLLLRSSVVREGIHDRQPRHPVWSSLGGDSLLLRRHQLHDDQEEQS